MARVRDDQLLVPSVLDRLIDEQPDNSRETPKSRHQVLRELKASVQRDLQNLLNTRWRSDPWPPELDELDLSLVSYGIPDFTGIQMSAASERERLRKIVEQSIKKFEPRFKSVRITLLDNKESTDRMLRFKIFAVLYAEPAPEAVVFDSQLEPVTGAFAVQTPG